MKIKLKSVKPKSPTKQEEPTLKPPKEFIQGLTVLDVPRELLETEPWCPRRCWGNGRDDFLILTREIIMPHSVN